MKIRSLNDVEAVRNYLARIGAEPRSLKSAVVRSISGHYWRDLAVIRFNKDGEVNASDLEYAPTDLERGAIKEGLLGVQWPEVKPLKSIVKPPPMIAEAKPEDIFTFRDKGGNIRMVQVRQERKGQKSYVPWTYWDDDTWRMCEPDGPLPLYNEDKIGDNTTVFIHEGAKAARHIQDMIDAASPEDKDRLAAHPWGRELSGAAHVGWIGGALSPYRTDWSVLTTNGVKRVYIVADNDAPGKAAVPAIAQQLRIPTFNIQFTDEFPASFDLADNFPEKMFSDNDGERFYTGPSFRECMHPATWATDLIPSPDGKGRSISVLRESFKGMWAYIEEADLFVCTQMPDIIRSEAILNKMLASFSHVNDTCRLIVRSYQGRSSRICYRPDAEGLMVTFRGSSAINLHVPSTIRPKKGDTKPWLEFLDYLFVNPEERKEAERWLATIIAKPDIRMKYGLLLISERQGVGKTTLGAAILAPLVGPNNVSYPSENDIMSPFNDWVAHKRLAIVNEIYSGSSWKAYHGLKSVITDTDVTVNQKYMRAYPIENWCHVLACSNSMRALKMESDDRRWFYPEITEVPWPKAKFDNLRAWISSGGLQIIKYWANAHGNYVAPSERAPMTARKKEMIEGSRSEAQAEAAAVAESLIGLDKPGVLLMKDVVQWVRGHVQGKVFDTDYEIRKTMSEAGAKIWHKRIKVGGRLQYVIMNEAAYDIVQRAEDVNEAIRQIIVKCGDIIESEM